MLQINPTIMRQTDTEYFTNPPFTDAILKDLYYENSYNEMVLDLYNKLGLINASDKLAQLELLFVEQEQFYQRMLMYCQLKNYYFSIQTGIESRDYLRFKQYEKMYLKELSFADNYNSSNFKPTVFAEMSRA